MWRRGEVRGEQKNGSCDPGRACCKMRRAFCKTRQCSPSRVLQADESVSCTIALGPTLHLGCSPDAHSRDAVTEDHGFSWHRNYCLTIS